MAYKPALSEGDLHSKNFKAIRTWVSENKSKLKAPPNKTILYSGRDYDLEDMEDELGKRVSPEDRKTFMGTPMYKVVEKWQKHANAAKDAKVGVGFKTLPDILKTLKPPVIVDKDRKEIPYPNAWVFFNELGKTADLDALLPNRKKIAKDVWGELSDIFASHAVGDIQIFDGAADDYGILQKDKDFIMRELPALLKDPKLSKQAKDLLAKKIGEFGSHFDRRYTELLRNLQDGRETLKTK
ncbi:MAG: hypothetical protein IV092_20595 [Burkholderiaceae bacterium]|nr:hypothetical protein [Burkholderiaceae bacterium]